MKDIIMILKKKEKKRQYGREHYKNLSGDEKILLLYKGKCKKNFIFFCAYNRKVLSRQTKNGKFFIFKLCKFVPEF